MKKRKYLNTYDAFSSLIEVQIEVSIYTIDNHPLHTPIAELLFDTNVSLVYDEVFLSIMDKKFFYEKT